MNDDYYDKEDECACMVMGATAGLFLMGVAAYIIYWIIKLVRWVA